MVLVENPQPTVDLLRKGYELSKQFFTENLGPQLITSTPEEIIAQYNAITLPTHPNSRGFSITPEVIKGIETAQDFAKGLKDLGFDLASLPQLSEVQQKLQQAKADLGIRLSLPDAEALKKVSVIHSLTNRLGLSANTQAELAQNVRACAHKSFLGIHERKIRIPNVETILNTIFNRYRNAAEAIGMERVNEQEEKPRYRHGRPVMKQGRAVTYRAYVVDIATVISEVDGFVGYAVEAGVADAGDLPMRQLIREVNQFGQVLNPSGTLGKPIETARRLHVTREEAIANHIVGAETLIAPELADEIRREAVTARLVDMTDAPNKPIETILTGMSEIRSQAEGIITDANSLPVQDLVTQVDD
ncbi:hypothetical protein MUP56_00285, partial [Patescibacteria group bacterium]|nr:hypothetical protein [Patescibacteria group bacterium]